MPTEASIQIDWSINIIFPPPTLVIQNDMKRETATSLFFSIDLGDEIKEFSTILLVLGQLLLVLPYC